MTMTFEEATAAHAAGDFEAAERGYLAFRTSRNGLYNLAVLYRQTHRLEEAAAAFRAIVERYPDLAIARRGLAQALLALRRYGEAWPLAEAHRQAPPRPDPVADYPEWRGEPLAGLRLTVVSEQGFGDQLMFARYLPLLKAAGADVTVACDPRHLARFFEHCGFATTPYLGETQKLPAADRWTFIGSIPYRLGLAAPPPPAYWPDPLGAGGGVGVVTHGNPAQFNDRNRSMSGAAADELLTLGRDLSPEATGARDFLETAQIVSELDLVITVCTSMAHLAGAMGKRCWVLLPAVGMCWRWNDGQRSDWYPDMRLFRQPAGGDWASVIARVRAELATSSGRA